MAIPSDVLKKWSNPGKNEMSKQTFAALRDLLINRLDRPLPFIFLQGSYANSTNVRDNSDIDIVVEFSSDIDVTCLKEYIFRKINNVNNFHFTKGAKTVKFKGRMNQYVPADIVPCVSVEGKTGCVKVYDSTLKKTIYNYPKIHIENGKKKSRMTNGNFKKAVRMMKNARNYLEDRNIKTGVASYTIECMLYNVPDTLFSGNESDVLYNVLDWFNKNERSMSKMRTQDGKSDLFSGSRSVKGAMQFIDCVIDLWNNWEEYQ